MIDFTTKMTCFITARSCEIAEGKGEGVPPLTILKVDSQIKTTAD